MTAESRWTGPCKAFACVAGRVRLRERRPMRADRRSQSGGGQEQAAWRSAGETVATPHRQAYRRAYEQLSAPSSKPMSTTGRTCPQRVQLPACRLTCDCACFETCAPPEPSGRQSQSPAGSARPPASRRCRRVLLVASALVFNVVDGLSDENVDGGRRRGYTDLERAVAGVLTEHAAWT